MISYPKPSKAGPPDQHDNVKEKIVKKVLSKNDFPGDIPEGLIDALNDIDNETALLVLRATFCGEHHFKHEAQRAMELASERSSVYIKICNALGKFF